MKFILSSWKGFEVDSSEFSASIETQDVPRVVKAFMESSFIEEQFRFDGFTKFINALEMAKNKNAKKFSKININSRSITEDLKYFISRIIEAAKEEDKEIDFKNILNSDKWKRGRIWVRLDAEEKLRIAIITKFLLQDFPKLASELDGCYYTFNRKDKHPDEAASTYIITLTGVPRQYSMNWNDTQGWASILASIRRKAPLKVKEFPI